MRNDFRVTVKVRNNNILKCAESLGVSVMGLAKFCGINYNFVNDLVNMTISPFDKDGNVRWQVDKICFALGKSFDELFAQSQYGALDTNKSEREVSAEQVFALMVQNASQCDQIESDERVKAVAEAINALRPRERVIIKKRFGIGCEPQTLEQIASDLGPAFNRERVRLIESDVIRKLRHPSFAHGKVLKELSR